MSIHKFIDHILFLKRAVEEATRNRLPRNETKLDNIVIKTKLGLTARNARRSTSDSLSTSTCPRFRHTRAHFFLPTHVVNQPSIISSGRLQETHYIFIRANDPNSPFPCAFGCVSFTDTYSPCLSNVSVMGSRACEGEFASRANRTNSIGTMDGHERVDGPSGVL